MEKLMEKIEKHTFFKITRGMKVGENVLNERTLYGKFYRHLEDAVETAQTYVAQIDRTGSLQHMVVEDSNYPFEAVHTHEAISDYVRVEVISDDERELLAAKNLLKAVFEKSED